VRRDLKRYGRAQAILSWLPLPVSEEEATMLIDFASPDWIVRDKKARIAEYKGKRAMCLKRGFAYRQLLFGYSDRICVFLNSQEVFSGDNSYGVSKQPGARGYVKDGEFNADLPLEKGSNELLLAVSEEAFGWGFIARLDRTDGIKTEEMLNKPDTRDGL